MYKCKCFSPAIVVRYVTWVMILSLSTVYVEEMAGCEMRNVGGLVAIYRNL